MMIDGNMGDRLRVNSGNNWVSVGWQRGRTGGGDRRLRLD